jgi:hypothetical protein
MTQHATSEHRKLSVEQHPRVIHHDQTPKLGLIFKNIEKNCRQPI